MEKTGSIEIRVVGKSGNKNLQPENYDIKHIRQLMQDVEDLLYPSNRKERPLITYDIAEGSVRHFFKTSMRNFTSMAYSKTPAERIKPTYI